ncbi:hypothetical protein [Nocardia farcinica]|uniref:hypothetical protein n=1 Tax=Nocardia farcinica TaxID=37329 RepID=UPI0034DB65A2
MIGPVMKTDAAVMSAGSKAFAALPPQVRLALVAVALLVGMAGCSAAWIDHQDYRPVPNVCRPDQEAYAAQARCVPAAQLEAPAGWQR